MAPKDSDPAASAAGAPDVAPSDGSPSGAGSDSVTAKAGSDAGARSSGSGYQVLARRFRPRAFGDVVGQGAILDSLRKALGSERIPHAFLFAGSRGVGKTTSARILARALNCESGPTADPCGTCGPCRTVLDGSNPDVIEIDAASHNLVDDIRDLRERVGFASMGARYKVYILDEVHMLTRSAFNAFLKTLEEPPAGVVFILATTELHKVPETIRSRCQVLHFRRIGEPEICERLRAICDAEGAELPDAVFEDIAASARGGMRDAETALERVLPVALEMGAAFDLDTYRQLVHRAGGDRVVEVVGTLIAGDAAGALRFCDEVIGAGLDEREILGELLEALRSVLLLKVDGAESVLVAASGAQREALQGLAEASSIERIEAMVQAGLLGRERLRRFEDRRLVLELSILRMAQAGALPALGELVDAMRSGAVAVAPAAAPPQPQAVGAEQPAAPDASRPARAAGATPAAGPVGGADLRTRLLKRLAADKPLLVGTIEECAVEGPDGNGTVVVRLQSTKRMHRDRLASVAVQGELEALLSAVAGSEIRLVVDTQSAADGAGGPRKEPGPEVHRVIEEFDGQLVDGDDAAQDG